jgi:hypothetical protein
MTHGHHGCARDETNGVRYVKSMVTGQVEAIRRRVCGQDSGFERIVYRQRRLGADYHWSLPDIPTDALTWSDLDLCERRAPVPL